MAKRLGNWAWYCGSDDRDDEMCDCRTREEAIAYGIREHPKGESFYIVEARMRVTDEKAMGDGKRDTAPFAETRNGEFVENTIAEVANV